MHLTVSFSWASLTLWFYIWEYKRIILLYICWVLVIYSVIITWIFSWSLNYESYQLWIRKKKSFVCIHSCLTCWNKRVQMKIFFYMFVYSRNNLNVMMFLYKICNKYLLSRIFSIRVYLHYYYLYYQYWRVHHFWIYC